MRVLITGKTGQVARCLADKAELFPDLSITFEDRKGLDLSCERSIIDSLQRNKPELVINTAAHTAVDRCEDETELAMQINGTAPGILARATQATGAGLIHISTDYVFSGTLDRPYVETDPVGPIGVYGKSKLAGEEAVRAGNSDHTILRTAWVYSPYGANFVKTMLRIARDRDTLSVVHDQLGNPTSAHDIALVLLHIAQSRANGAQVGKGQTYHFAGGVCATWYEFACEIFRLSKKLNGPCPEVMPIASSDFPTKATRPANSRLDSAKLLADFAIDLDRTSMIKPDLVEAILEVSQT